MRIVGYIILGIYHAGIVIPFFYIIPQSLIVTAYLFYEKRPDKKYLTHFFVIAVYSFLLTSALSHLYFKLRGYVSILESIPILYNPIVLVLMLFFAAIPLLPIPTAYYLNKKIYKKKQRKLFYFATAYFFYAVLLMFFFIRNVSGSYAISDIISKPLLIPNLVNFTEIFDIFSSASFHDLLHFIF